MCRSRFGVAAALALLLLNCPRASKAQEFSPGCPLPFGNLAEHHPIDDSCAQMRGDVPDPPAGPNDSAHALQNTVKNNLCATGVPISVTFFTFKQLQKKLDQKVPAAVTWTREHLPGNRGIGSDAMPPPHEEWKSIAGHAFTASGRVHVATLARHPDESTGPAVWIDGAIYAPGDQIDGDRIIGFKASDGSEPELAALFNLEARRTR